MPKYSIIIPTFNRAEQLENCLDAVSQQSIPAMDYEIIIADDGSTDNTASVIQHFTEKHPELAIRYIHQKNAGCGAARNLGIKNAQGDILFFTDDDCVVPKTWMQELLKGLEAHPEAIGVGGWYTFDKGVLQNNTLAHAFHLSEKTSYLNFEDYTVLGNTFGNPAGNTANMAYRKSVFEAVGFFDTYTKKTARIDTEFKNRVIYAGFPILYIPLIIRHTKMMTLWEFVAKSFRYGIADYYLSTRFVNLDNIISFLSSQDSKNFFFLLSRVKNYEPDFPKWSYIGWLFLRWAGAKYAAFKKMNSPILIKPKVTPRGERKEYNNNQFQYGYRYDQNDYFFSETFVRARGQAHEQLSAQYSQPMATLIIPFFNRSDYVTQEFIEGINRLQANKSAVEIILVDDGSTDDTLTTLREAVGKIRFRTRIITQSNGGPAAARNAGIRQSSGNYIFFTDSDVQLPQYWLCELLAPFFLDEKIALTGGGQIHPKPKTYFDKWRNGLVSQQGFTVSNKLNYPPYDTANMCVKKSSLEGTDLLYFDESFRAPGYEDFDYALRIKDAGKLTALVPQFVLNVRSLDLTGFARMSAARSSGYDIMKKKYAARLKSYPQIFDYANMNIHENRYQFFGEMIQLLFSKNRRINIIRIVYRATTYNNEKHPWLTQFIKIIASSERIQQKAFDNAHKYT